jgi:hypothetical protein
MPTPKECRCNAEDCLRLAREAKEIYVRMALIELATEFRAMAEYLERRRRTLPHSAQSPRRRRRV